MNDEQRWSLRTAPLRSVSTEWGEFDRRFQVVARDRAAATALVDARLMPWLLDGDHLPSVMVSTFPAHDPGRTPRP